jgi:flagellar biosynthesis GTPase FlhF
MIDTPGGSQRNAGYLQEMHDLLTAADPMEVHLVMSAGVSLPVARDIIRRYADVQPDQVILTKLDEAPLSLELLPLLYGSGMALSYFSAGQQIDRHWDIASAEVLFRYFMNP